jgi:hypothetical protein
MLNEVQGALKGNAHRFRIDVDQRKGNGFSYFTFISVDALQELRKWFATRQGIVNNVEEASEAIFIKNNGGVFDIDDFEGNFSYHVRKNKLKDGPWSLSSHMFRKLFKTESRPPERNVDQDCVEFMMGHLSGIQSVGGIYDRTPELYVDVIEREYAKLEPYLNIYSQRTALGSTDLSQEEITDLKELLKKMKMGKVRIDS